MLGLDVNLIIVMVYFCVVLKVMLSSDSHFRTCEQRGVFCSLKLTGAFILEF